MFCFRLVRKREIQYVEYMRVERMSLLINTSHYPKALQLFLASRIWSFGCN